MSSIGGAKSAIKVSDAKRNAGLGRDASNSVTESLHGGLTYGLQVYRTARIDHLVAEGMTRHNKDFDRGLGDLVRRNRSNNETSGTNFRALGAFHLLEAELKRTLILAGKEHGDELRKMFDRALHRKNEVKQEKERIKYVKKLEDSQEEYITAIYFWEQYHAPRCW